MSRLIIKTRSPFSFGNHVGDEVFVDTDHLKPNEKTVLRYWMKQYSETVRDEVPLGGVDTKPDVIERPAPDVKFVDPIAQHQNDSIRRQIDKTQADERLLQYQIQQGLVDDQHNANLIRDWLDLNMRGYVSAVNIDYAIHLLRPSLHFQQLSTFTKRLATLR